ncbi:uncharacterized protein LOC142322367 [Lycorma delicatula]|uniref:uncharacterized protein LOC142322367 n=1 Tax=Lycorma delicatula TaxID=130591 RepID=UPI003F510543
MYLSVWLSALVAGTLFPPASLVERPHSRQKRLIWITTDGRLALPPGTHLTITPTISLPFVRYPPEGFLSNMTISLPFTIDFDSLGLTDNQNPYGVLPPLLARSMGRSMGVMIADYIARMMDKRRRKSRGTFDQPPPEHLHGGERALLYILLEDFLANFGMDGKACLLRAICEVHGHTSLRRFGLLGEVVQLFFTASKSPYSELLEEYIEAEKAGRDDGDCWRYYKNCPKSLFRTTHNKYTDDGSFHEDNEVEEDEISEKDLKDVENDVRKSSTSKVNFKTSDIGVKM